MTPGQTITFHEVSAPILDPVTKFGGQPVWLDTPQWPLSRETGNPMRFIGQVALDDAQVEGGAGKLAYLFMTEENSDDFVDGTYEPEGGENAVLVQPGGTPAVPCAEQATGPTLFRMVERPGEARLQPEDCEFRVELAPSQVEDDEDAGVEESKLGSKPIFLQGEEIPRGGPWRFALQLDSCSVPFYVNFGDAGVGYAFVDEGCTEGRFLWQCG